MKEAVFDVVIVGGGTGAVAAALTLYDLDPELNVLMLEPTDWIGGQLTSQCVPPDEHPWVETAGVTRRYQEFRHRVRQHYAQAYELPYTDPRVQNPGSGWVSRVCHEPRIAVGVLETMVAPARRAKKLEIWHGVKWISAAVHGDRVTALEIECPDGERVSVLGRVFLEASELGDLLDLAKIEHRIGAETQALTDEPHALTEAPSEPVVQGFTWVAMLELCAEPQPPIDRPASYDFWRDYEPPHWTGRLFSETYPHVQTGEPARLPILSDTAWSWFSYRQVTREDVPTGRRPITAMNWPQNDYCLRPMIGVSAEAAQEAEQSARDLTLASIYWLQTEAPRPDGGTGIPELRLSPDAAGSHDGLALAPYHREARRLEAQRMLSEHEVGAACNPGAGRMAPIEDGVAIGCYRIDLHPRTGGYPTIDLDALPFQVPLGSLVPVRVENVIACGKALGVTHIANGCTRLHPVEWAIGEAAAVLALQVLAGTPAQGIRDDVQEVQRVLEAVGAPTDWPQLRPV